MATYDGFALRRGCLQDKYLHLLHYIILTQYSGVQALRQLEHQLLFGLIAVQGGPVRGIQATAVRQPRRSNKYAVLLGHWGSLNTTNRRQGFDSRFTAPRTDVRHMALTD